MSRKKKEAKKEARLAAQTAKEEQFAAEIAEAQKNPDPVEQILKLTKVQSDIETYAQALSFKINKNDNKWQTLGLGSGIALFCGGGLMALVGAAVAPVTAAGVVIATSVAAHVVYAGVVPFLSSIPVMVTGAAVNGPANRKAIEARKTEYAGHITRIAGFAKQVTEMKETLINDQAEQIFLSPSYEKVRALPGLSEQFAAIAAQQTAKMKKELEQERVAKEAAQKALRQGRRTTAQPALGDYKKFNDVLGRKK